jgi:AP-1-like factor
MDYPYFTTAPQQQQPYHFLGLPPTPAHTGSDNSDHFSNSPPVREFHNDQSYSQSFLTPKQDVFEYQNYESFNQHYNNGLPAAKPPSPLSQHKPSISNTATQNYDMNNGVDMNDDSNRRGSNSDDDDNMTPAQTRRKAQNRAA